ncbi:MAG: glycerophosphodiester phosphodiesterase family protein [Canibacter sp.]
MLSRTPAEQIHPQTHGLRDAQSASGAASRPWRVPAIIAHRGASGYRPEHTEAAYRLAFELGADAVEPDVVPTLDGVLVVRHENEISTTTDIADHPEFRDRKTTKMIEGQRITGWFTEDFTWDELSTLRCRERLQHIRAANRKYDGVYPMLRLRDVLAIVGEEQERADRELRIVIEVKHASYFADSGFHMARLVAREIRRAGWEDRDSNMVFESFELGVLRDFHELGLTSPRVFLAEDEGSPADAGRGEMPKKPFAWFRSRRGLKFLSAYVDGISVRKGNALQKRFLKKRPVVSSLVRDAHIYGLDVYVWTLRPENVFLEPGFRRLRGISHWGNWQEEFALFMRSGVAGVFADQPDLAVAIRELGRTGRGNV